MPGGMGQHCKTSPGALIPGLDPHSQGILWLLSLPPCPARALPGTPCPVSV